MGVDALPDSVRNSRVLTGNELGRLGSILNVPDETLVNDHKLTELSDLFIQLQDSPQELELQLHTMAQQLLEQGRLEDAWKTLLAFNQR